ncbi:hypothetical protein DERP_004509 [Dermatophagoides pteronyssinus]|uniref:Uncharacterized protein n=1 Tax=Dermatophagoides pteronyssinus TaxID=6956 RepID=A0ABQ8JNZ5_DERPT|nr:hypothetical protein DERP_004509 [Dermatophagoides pteronyssinus]
MNSVVIDQNFQYHNYHLNRKAFNTIFSGNSGNSILIELNFIKSSNKINDVVRPILRNSCCELAKLIVEPLNNSILDNNETCLQIKSNGNNISIDFEQDE